MEASADLLYGFRGTKYEVDLLSAFEMMRFWKMVKVDPPSKNVDQTRSRWTEEGLSLIHI